LRCDSNIAAASPPMFCSLFIPEKFKRVLKMIVSDVYS
jgi:hypothetical protein